ncbi:hypothetical protein KC19_10G113400 [Ceratodon purpureus]|uniref:Pentatricopeptide repeat-containing protein n=1 Tax=Ceratodon purpureus TaxID=3225 RepID=A0A8T0GLY3_CERPU|nr:hypothetical protein KC19_10G113400 [Ceratodon purpureus]
MALAPAPRCLGHGSCKPVHPVGLGELAFVSSRTRIVVSCSSGTLHNEDTSQDEAQGRVSSSKNGNGSEPTSSSKQQQQKTLGEQLRLLNLESVSKRAMGTKVASNRLEYFESPVKNRVQQHKGGTRRASSNSGVVGQVLDMVKSAKESEEGVALALKEFDGALTPFDVVTILNNLNSWRLALSLFKWLRAERSSSLNIYTYNVMLKVLRRGRQWDLSNGIALDMATVGILPDNITYSTLISCANRCNRQEEAMAWFDRMHEAGCVPDGVTYSTMLDVYGKIGKYDEAVALYENLRKSGWKPDKVTYGTMVRLFGRAGYLKEAVSTFKEMKESGVQPDSIVYNILISCLGRAGRMGHALRIFEEMEQAGVKPNAVTLSTVMETYNRSGNVVDGLGVFSRLRKGVTCDVIVYNTVIKMCGDAGLVAEADQYLREMGEAGCQPNDWTYRNMISLYAKQGMTVEAQRMFTSLVEVGYSADVMAYTCLLQAYGNAKDYKKVEDILNEMVSANCTPDERLCCVVLNLLNSCDTKEDMELIRRCLKKCNPMLEDLVGQLFEEKIVLKNMQSDFQSLLKDTAEDAHKPICNSLVQLAWHKGNRNHAFQLLPLLHTLGVYPGLQSKSPTMWSLHLRSLSTGAAHCALLNWLSALRYAIQEGQELPSRIIVETGVGRQVNADELRLIVVISSVLKDMSSPFEECADRQDWLEASGADVRRWLETFTLDLPTVSN